MKHTKTGAKIIAERTYDPLTSKSSKPLPSIPRTTVAFGIGALEGVYKQDNVQMSDILIKDL